MEFSKTLMVWILRWILTCVVSHIALIFISSILKLFLCLIQVSLFLNLRFDVISHFLPNLFVTGIQ